MTLFNYHWDSQLIELISELKQIDQVHETIFGIISFFKIDLMFWAVKYLSNLLAYIRFFFFLQKPGKNEKYL